MQLRYRRLSPNQRDFILRAGVENGRRAEWDFAYEQYKASDSDSFLIAMTYTRESSIVYE